jgi:hypothetical protein
MIDISPVSGRLHTNIYKICINRVIVMKQEKISPLGLFEAEIEVIIGPDVDLLPKIPYARIIETFDNLSGVI